MINILLEKYWNSCMIFTYTATFLEFCNIYQSCLKAKSRMVLFKSKLASKSQIAEAMSSDSFYKQKDMIYPDMHSLISSMIKSSVSYALKFYCIELYFSLDWLLRNLLGWVSTKQIHHKVIINATASPITAKQV